MKHDFSRKTNRISEFIVSNSSVPCYTVFVSTVPIWCLNSCAVKSMPRIKMTVRAVDAIRAPTAGKVDYWDAYTPGFGLRVSAGGRRAWVLMYRHSNVKRSLTLGTYPALSLADAREQAGRALRAVQYDGVDPAANKKVERTAETFEELA